MSEKGLSKVGGGDPWPKPVHKQERLLLRGELHDCVEAARDYLRAEENRLGPGGSCDTLVVDQVRRRLVRVLDRGAATLATTHRGTDNE
jgi:hypothetical protein